MQMPHLQIFVHTCLNSILNTLRVWCFESTVSVVRFQNLLKNGEWLHTVYDDGLLFGFLCHLGSETLVCLQTSACASGRWKEGKKKKRLCDIQLNQLKVQK